MAELTFKSPGVSTREIDLSGPSRVGPVGTPAGVIGTSAKGRAFVPLVFANLSEFVAEFGAVGPDKFGPMALREWFSNARAGLYLKVLGAGDGKARLQTSPTYDSRGNKLPKGAVKNAGFVVGSEIVNQDNGNVGSNTYSGTERGAIQASVILGVAARAAAHAQVAGKIITLDDGEGTINSVKKYVIVNAHGDGDSSVDAATGTVLTGDIEVSDGNDAVGAQIGGIVVKLTNNAATQLELLTQLKAAIEHENGHDGTIKVSAIANGDGNNSIMTLTQKSGGRAGNTLVTDDLGRAEVLIGHAQASMVAINSAAAKNYFVNGEDGHGGEGRTHFLSVLMKESAPSAASATITYKANLAADDTLTLTSADATTKTYKILAGGESGTKEGDSSIRVTLGGNADATFTSLITAINHANGHNANVANSKITITNNTGEGDTSAGNIVLTQTAAGRSGNTTITHNIASITAKITDMPTKFSGGKGERIFSEAGSGASTSSNASTKYANVLRGVLMYPSGVSPSLRASRVAINNNAPIGQIGLKPGAKAKIVFDKAVTAGNDGRITLISTDATSKTYTPVNDDATPGADQFKRGDSGLNDAADAIKAATGFATAVNLSHAGKIFAHASGSTVTLSQTAGGTAGNTVITPDASFPDDEATFDSHFLGGENSVIQLAGSTGAFEDNPTIRGIENGGSPLGKVDTTNGKQEFVMILNGHKTSVSYPNAVTASFDPQAPNYFPKVLNTDPAAIQTAGHYLYTHYDVFSTYALPTNTSNPYLTADGQSGDDIAMLLPSLGARNEGTVTKPNTECFSDRFRTAVSPTFVSQKFGGTNQPLFRLHSLDDGASGNSVYKITIENLRRSQSDKNRYGTFDLLIRRFSDNDREQVVLEKFSALSLDPNSERFISRIIGDQRLFYDFDKRAGSQKLSLSGKFENNSNYVRVEVAVAVENGTVDPTALPVGFRGPQKLNIDNAYTFAAVDAGIVDSTKAAHKAIVTPPVPMRRNLAVGEVPKKRVASALNWGIQFEVDDFYLEPNKNSTTSSDAKSWTKYFPDFDQDDLPLASERTGSSDADAYNNNKFTLENIQVVTNASSQPDAAEWAAAEYRRNGTLDNSILDVNGSSASAKTRFLNMLGDLDLGSVRRYLKFNCFVAGGFDGVEIFDKEKSSMSDTAVMREVNDVIKQGGKAGATAATYMKAIDVLAERSDVDIQLLAIPGIRQTIVTDKAIDAVEERFDAMYIMDTIVYDTEDAVITSSAQKVSVTNTVNNFNNRVLDTSFAAAYFPDVILSDPSTGQNIQVPPSVPVIGAFALNDQLAHPWFAPAGFTRGAMSNVAETQVKLNRDNLDSLYDVDINPLTSFPHSEGVVVFGQKTLLRTQSSLDRVNVRRLLIELRRRVRKVSNSFIFEPNREATLARFSSQVNPILRQIQQQQGVDRFLVKIDTTTTTQNDVENNTLRGKIFLQPTRSVEFISLDFVITNAGAEI